MSMNNTQRIMGSVVLLCGGALLAILLFKGKQELQANGFEFQSIPTAIKNQIQATPPEPVTAAPSVHNLGVDVATEQRLLEQQRINREKSVALQEAKAAEFLQAQQQAEAAAAQKAAEEYAAVSARKQSALESSDNIPPQVNTGSTVSNSQNNSTTLAAQRDASPAPTAQQLQTQQALMEKRKAEIEKVAQQQRMIAAQKRKTAEENAAAQQKALAEKKRLADEIKALEAKRQATLEKLQAEEQKRKALEASQLAAKQKAEAEAKKRAEIEAKKRADTEEARRILEGDAAKVEAASAKLAANAATKTPATPKTTTQPVTPAASSKPTRGWVVQVALAATQANADSMVAKLRAKGYNVTTSRTSKGVRVLVGASGNGADRSSADATRQKITADASLGMNSAWVMNWQPPKTP